MKIAAIRSTSKRFIIASLFSSLMLSNCGKDSPTKSTAPSTLLKPSTPTASTAAVPSRIQITPTSATLNAIGQTLQLNASVLDANNSPIPGAVVSWTSANTAVAKVNDQGLVTAVANGNAQITAQSGSLTARVNVTVKQLASRVLITPSSVTLNEVGQTIQLSANVADARNNTIPDATVSCSSADTTVATVSTQGLVTAVAKGMTQVTARSGSMTGRVTITVMESNLEREALVKLYNATDGPNWTNKTGWLSAAPLGSWHGVYTDENGKVIQLILDENNLKGTLIPELRHLTSLKTLALSKNQLSGNIPQELGELSQLKQLSLWGNQLTGTIPQELGQLARLEWLSLAENRLTGTIPPEIGQLTNLIRLNLFDNMLSGAIPTVFGQLTNLTELLLSKNELTGTIPSEFGQLTELTLLFLWGNKLEGDIPGALTQLTKLEKLSLSSNQLTGNLPPELGRLTNLTELYLHANRLVGIIPPELGNLTQLTELSLANNQLFGALEPELLQLVNLDKLWLQGTQICAPDDPEFRNWLGMISDSRVASCADARPGFAPVDQREFDARFVGKVLTTSRSIEIEFTSEGRYTGSAGSSPEGSYTYSLTGTNTGRLTQINDESESRCIISLTFTAHEKGIFAYRCGENTVCGTSELWRISNAPDPDSYNIEIVWIGEEPDAPIAEAAKWAATRWEGVITNDLPDERFGAPLDAVTVDDLFENGDYERLFGYVDDLVIFAEVAFIDGENGSLAKAGPYYIRSSASSPLPYVGVMTLDTDDLDQLSPAALYDLILHEMGHVLGIGTLWDKQNLLENPSLDQNDEPILPPPDTHFTGMEAIEAFDDVGGTSYRGKKVPVENEEGGLGTQDSHWRDSVIGPNELMDGFVNTEATHQQPMSLITILSLADLGYEVDDTQADSYMLPTPTFARRLEGTTGNWIRLNCIVR